MDITAFSGDNFDVKDWINKTFRNPEAKENKEQYASSLVMKLQLLIAKLNASLEEQSDGVCQSLPRILREADSLQQEAALLKAKMSAVRQDIDKVNRETGASMETLVQMDLLKERLQQTTSALKEADNWTTLSTEIEEALDSGDLALIAKKLVGIQGSLKILCHVPDYEDRLLHVEGLKNRLEALASPQLVAAFNSNDTEKSKFFVGIFADMDRSPQLLKYYRKCVRAKLLKHWSSTVEDMQECTVLEWAEIFYEHVIEVCQQQMKWFSSVFVSADPVENMTEILLDVYQGLEPRFDFCLDAGLKQQTDPLKYLIDVKGKTDEHCKKLADILVINIGRDARPRELAKTLYQPFKAHTKKYLQYESSFMLAELVNVNQTSKDIIDELRNISNSVPRFVSSVKSASKRCCQFTEGCGFMQLTQAVEDCMENYVEKYRNLMRRLEKRKGGTVQNWTVMQQSLSLNQTVGDLILQLEQLEMELAIDFLDQTKTFLGPDAKDKPFEQFHLFLLEGTEMGQLQEFYNAVKQGSDYPILGAALRVVSKLCEDIQMSTFTIMFHSIQEQLTSSVTDLAEVWRSQSAGSASREQDMPDFSFTPQEYITQIGQYLMTLPQHLEPYMSNESPCLSRALQENVFPYCKGLQAEQNPADFLLGCISAATCQTYQEAILKISEVSSNSAKQLSTDIGYLGDILDDLGHPLSDGLKSILLLLKLSPKDFWVSSTGHPPKLVSAIRQMRNLSAAGK